MPVEHFVTIVSAAAVLALAWFNRCRVIGHHCVTIVEHEDPERTKVRDRYRWCVRCRTRLEGTD